MRLTALDAHFIRYETRVEDFSEVVGDPLVWKAGDPTKIVNGPREYRVRVEGLPDAQGVQFDCPKCGTGNGHRIEVTFADRGVAPHQGCHNKAGQPTRWSVSGSGLDDLTTQPSVLVEDACGWHGFVTNGDAA